LPFPFLENLLIIENGESCNKEITQHSHITMQISSPFKFPHFFNSVVDYLPRELAAKWRLRLYSTYIHIYTALGIYLNIHTDHLALRAEKLDK